MNNSPIVLLFILNMTLSISIARGDNEPLLTLLGKNVMRDEIGLRTTKPSKVAHEVIGKLFPNGLPDNWEECYRINEMSLIIVSTIQSTFTDDNNLRPTEEEIEGYIGRLKYVYEYADGQIITNDLNHGIDQQTLRYQAFKSLTEWKLNVALYEKYGGRIAIIMNNIKPIDALYRLLKEAEEAGKFTIHDNDLRTSFWSCIIDCIPVTYLSDEDGINALYRHPADDFVAITLQKMSDVMSKTDANIDSIEDGNNDEEGKENSEHAPPEGRGEAPRP